MRSARYLLLADEHDRSAARLVACGSYRECRATVATVMHPPQPGGWRRTARRKLVGLCRAVTGANALNARRMERVRHPHPRELPQILTITCSRRLDPTGASKASTAASASSPTAASAFTARPR